MVALTAGCYLQHGLEEDPPREVPPPRTTAPPHTTPFSPEVLASISSVMLGDDCGDGHVEPDGDSADRDSAGGGAGVGDCADEGCWAPCEQTSMQLLFDVRRIDDPLQVEILRVRLRDYETREVYDELVPRDPKHWNDELGYIGWDEWLRAVDPERTSYDLSAPDWARIGGGDYWSTYGMTFVLEVDVRIGEVEETLWSDPINRAPDIDT